MTQLLNFPTSYPVLPDGKTKFDVLRVLADFASHIKMPKGLQSYLECMISMTLKDDWTDPMTEPVCYEEQVVMADKLGVTDRCLRKYDAALDQLGLTKKTALANGKRGNFGGRKLGISLSPIIERFAEIERIAQNHSGTITEKKALRRMISSAKRSLTSNLTRLQAVSDDLSELHLTVQNLPKRIAGFDLDQLKLLYAEVNRAACHAEKLAAELLCRNSWADEAEQINRPIIQDSTHNLIESKTIPASTVKDDPEESLEAQKGFDPQRTANRLALTFSLEDFMLMANDDLQAYLASSGPQSMTARSFIEATIGYWAACGHSMTAWRAAENALGPMFAAVSVLVITANIDRRVNPILQPAAMLHKFVELAKEGRLNLEGSLHGLFNRRLKTQSLAA